MNCYCYHYLYLSTIPVLFLLLLYSITTVKDIIDIPLKSFRISFCQKKKGKASVFNDRAMEPCPTLQDRLIQTPTEGSSQNSQCRYRCHPDIWSFGNNLWLLSSCETCALHKTWEAHWPPESSHANDVVRGPLFPSSPLWSLVRKWPPWHTASGGPKGQGTHSRPRNSVGRC